MPSLGSQVRNRGPILLYAKKWVRGLYRFFESTNDQAGDYAQFEITTGSSDLADIAVNSGTRVILPAASVPVGMRCYITGLEVSVQGATAWTGGTGTNVSLTIEDTAGTDIITFTGNALTANVYYNGKFNGTAPTGVTDTLLRTLGPSTALNQGIQVVTGNSTAGSNCRVRILGYFAP